MSRSPSPTAPVPARRITAATHSSGSSSGTRLQRLAPGRVQMPTSPPVKPPLQQDYFGHYGMSPVHRRVQRLVSDDAARRPEFGHHASHGSRNTVSPGTPWEGATHNVSVQVAPEAMDYFQQVTAERHSWRAMQNLGLVAGGRCLLTLGLAGVLEAYVPGAITHTAGGAPPPCMPLPRAGFRVNYHPSLFGLGIAGTTVGLLAHTWGIHRFWQDTSAINTRRAWLVASVALTGATLVTGGGTFYLYGILDQRDKALWEALPLRALGNFCVFGAIPNSFSASEIVWGNIPLQNRLLLRDLFFALGGMFLMTWAQISTPDPPAPLWAREVTQCLGIICIAIGGALPRVDGQRAAADLRAVERRRSDAMGLPR